MFPQAWKQFSLNSRNRSLLVFIIVCFVIYARRPDKILNPQPYAEDGSIFIYQAIEDPVGSLLTPFAGYLHFVPRIVTGLSLLAGMSAAPLLMDLSSLVISAFCISYLAWVRFRFLISNDWIRYMLCILIACIPSNGEIIMNITNIQWFLGFYLTLWALDQWQNFDIVETRQRASSILESGIATISNLSTAIGFLLLPILIHVALKRSRAAKSRRFTVLVAIPIMGSLIQFLVFALASRFLEGNSDDLVSAFHLSTAIMTNMVYENSTYIPAGTVLYIATIFVLAFSAITYSFVRTPIGRNVRGWLMVLPGAFILATGVFRTIANAGRYYFFPSALLLILTVASFQSLKRKRAQVFAVLLLVIVGTNFMVHYMIPPSSDFKFQSYAKFYDPNGGSFIYAPIPPFAGYQGAGGWFCPIPASPVEIESSISPATTYQTGSIVLDIALAYPSATPLDIKYPDLSVNKANTTFVFLRGWTVGVTDPVNVFVVVDGVQAFPTSFHLNWLWGGTAPQGWDDSGWVGTITLSGLSVGWHVVSFLILTQEGENYVATTKLFLDVYE